MSAIAFVLNGRQVSLPPGTSPTLTLLDWLRGPAVLPGTKEGCAEGDCGACTVVLEGTEGARTPINACLALLGQMHGQAIRTVEGLRGADGGPHPIQRAMAESDGTQCGFCTPGIVMTAWAHAREGGEVHEALAGNLCRCTGYRPILEVFAGLADDCGAAPDLPAPEAVRFEAPGQVFHRPVTLEALLALRAAHPEAWLLAGGTDLGLRVSDHRERPAEVICLLGVPELHALRATPDAIETGAAVSYARLLALFRQEPGFAPFATLLARLGSRQIRGLGTLGGNLGTASPIGDALPPLLALGAQVTLASVRGRRVLAVEDFLKGYRVNDLAADEVVVSVTLPRPAPGELFVCEKVSKRHDQDIATVGAAFRLRLEGERVAEAVLAFGGVGPMAARARRAEAALRGRRLDAAALAAAAEALAEDIAPQSDWRGSAAYRLMVAQGLLRRLQLRAAQPDLALDVADYAP
ncbi:FAD binding domain-containing protein [Falsiroseomonas tokyonensis]|uniref:FAD binding domain-containing protein n=1 Tax=Falsiroseomonas tokyonensis TaxID=430521 RepID=A0ABV7BYA5_9PROT|nr:FAD binding domain-containing protein [Falsiroseomonas tokyonensis]MBU8539856.1 FAD binding domain-containing protein [Falsiroseomonas tokyonensis]